MILLTPPDNIIKLRRGGIRNAIKLLAVGTQFFFASVDQLAVALEQKMHLKSMNDAADNELLNR